jgi:hypothetical protein
MKQYLSPKFLMFVLAIPAAFFINAFFSAKSWDGTLKLEWLADQPVVSFRIMETSAGWHKLTCEAESEGYWGCYFPKQIDEVIISNLGVVKLLLDKSNLRIIAIFDLGDFSHYDFRLKKNSDNLYEFNYDLEYLIGAAVNNITIRQMEAVGR